MNPTTRVKLALLIRRWGLLIRNAGEHLIACSYRVEYRDEDDPDDAAIELVDLSLDDWALPPEDRR